MIFFSVDNSGDSDQQATCSAVGGDFDCNNESNSLTRSSAVVDSGGGDRKERACDSLIMCIVTTLNQGLRNGGGIGDILRAPSSHVRGNLVDFILIDYYKILLYAGTSVCGTRRL